MFDGFRLDETQHELGYATVFIYMATKTQKGTTERASMAKNTANYGNDNIQTHVRWISIGRDPTRAGLCYGIHLYGYKDAKGNHRESEHGKEHRKLWQRQHPSAQAMLRYSSIWLQRRKREPPRERAWQRTPQTMATTASVSSRTRSAYACAPPSSSARTGSTAVRTPPLRSWPTPSTKRARATVSSSPSPPTDPHRLPRRLPPGRGQRPRLPARLEPVRKTL